MSLPILQANRDPTPEDLVRLYHRTELHWTRHLGEEAVLDAGTAFTNAQLPRMWDANRMLDAALPPGVSIETAIAEAEAHFASAGTRCAQWTMNPAVPRERTAPLVDHLTATGWHASVADILLLRSAPPAALPNVPGLTIIPARASYRHARALAESAALTQWGRPELGEAAMLHLDDPHWDASIALKDGAAIARVGVLAVGDIGRIDEVYVDPQFRSQGIARAMMGRALEICARSLFKHVMLAVLPDNTGAQRLYHGLGFRKVGQIVNYRAEWTANA